MSRVLIDKGYDVFGLVRSGSASPEEGTTALIGDMRDQGSLENALEVSRPDEVYNFAAISSLAETEAAPEACADINGRGPRRLLEAMERAGMSSTVRFCQASSGLIFGPPDGETRTEDSPLAPQGPYALAKAEGHRLMATARGMGVHAVSAILFNHESPLRSARFVTRRVTKAVAEIIAGKTNRLSVGNLGAVRDWGFAGDYVHAMWLTLQHDEPGDYVIAMGRQHSVRDLVRTAFSVAGLDDWERYVDAREDHDEVWSPADPSTARRTLGWVPEYDFEGLVQLMVEHDLQTV
jgi:GDPmannose 4,6-dehydratase